MNQLDFLDGRLEQIHTWIEQTNKDSSWLRCIAAVYVILAMLVLLGCFILAVAFMALMDE